MTSQNQSKNPKTTMDNLFHGYRGQAYYSPLFRLSKKCEKRGGCLINKVREVEMNSDINKKTRLFFLLIKL